MGRGIGGGARRQCRVPSRYSEHANRGPGAPENVPRPAMSGGTVAGRGEPANRCWGAKGYTDRVKRYAARDGGQINKLWERRVAAAAPACPNETVSCALRRTGIVHVPAASRTQLLPRPAGCHSGGGSRQPPDRRSVHAVAAGGVSLCLASVEATEGTLDIVLPKLDDDADAVAEAVKNKSRRGHGTSARSNAVTAIKTAVVKKSLTLSCSLESYASVELRSFHRFLLGPLPCVAEN